MHKKRENIMKITRNIINFIELVDKQKGGVNNENINKCSSTTKRTKTK